MRANGIAGCAGRIAGILAPQLVVVMYATGGVRDVLSVIVGVLVAMAAILAIFGIETNQRSLEEIAPPPTVDIDTALTGASVAREPRH
jgi:putative MFS transporter